jgi:hypothetical protein
MSIDAGQNIVLGPPAIPNVVLAPPNPGLVIVPVAGVPGPQGPMGDTVLVTLTYASTVAVDASQGNYFRLALAGNATIGAPSNPTTDRQKIMFEIEQPASGGPCTVTWDGGTGGFEWGSNVTVPTLSNAPLKKDLIGFIYNAENSLWYGIAYALGY